MTTIMYIYNFFLQEIKYFFVNNLFICLTFTSYYNKYYTFITTRRSIYIHMNRTNILS